MWVQAKTGIGEFRHICVTNEPRTCTAQPRDRHSVLDGG